MNGGVQGLAEAYSLLGAVPEAARAELGVELAILGREALAMQRAATPVDTGALRDGLSIQLSIERLKVRIGLIGLRGGRNRGRALVRSGGRAFKTNQGDLFYGVVVNFGRHAQNVVVERRRRVNGKLRLLNRRKLASDIAATYTMRVKARDPVDFINAPGPAFESDAVQQLAEFWSRVLARAAIT